MKKLAVLFILFAISCKSDHYATFNGFTQGTVYMIVVKNPAEGAGDRIEAVFEEIDLTFSMFNPASLTSRLNRNEANAATPLFEECFALAKEVHDLTDGWFDPTVKPLVDAWGFGPGEQQEVPCVECLMEYVGFDKVRIENGHIIKDDPRVQLDFSSIAKGFTVDKLAEMLENDGTTDYMVDVGGEVRARGMNPSGDPWRIGISKPVEGFTNEYETVVSLGGDTTGTLHDADARTALTSIATSGNYRNWFVDEKGRKRVHTIDPQTGFPALGEILSASIATSSCAIADAWATGIMACGSVRTARLLFASATLSSSGTAAENIEHYIIYDNSKADIPGTSASFYSPGFPL